MTNPPREPEAPIRRLRHDLSNPLSALLAETQLQLLNADQLVPEVATAFREIERLAQRMRDILKAIP
jgi:signal transduction histidine kinase